MADFPREEAREGDPSCQKEAEQMEVERRWRHWEDDSPQELHRHREEEVHLQRAEADLMEERKRTARGYMKEEEQREEDWRWRWMLGKRVEGMKAQAPLE